MAASPRRGSLRRYLVAGVLVWLPILATIWVVSFMLHIMDRITVLMLPPSWRPQALVGFALPGVGLVMAFVVVLLTGLLVTNLIGRRLVVWGEDLLNRIPVVRTVYGGVKSFAERHRRLPRDRAAAAGRGAGHDGGRGHEDGHHLRGRGAAGGPRQAASGHRKTRRLRLF